MSDQERRYPDDAPPESTATLPKPAIEAEMEVTAEEQQERPVRPHRRRRRRRRSSEGRHGCLVAIGYTALILGISMALSSLIILFANEVFAFVKPDVTAVIEISEDDNFQSISEKLGEAGLIKYPALFNLYLNIAKSGTTFEAGSYEVSAKLDYPAIARAMKKTHVRETVRVTIPEGYTTAQIVSLLEENRVCTAEELYTVIESGEFDYEWLVETGEGRRRLEGYLFPDTYEFYIGDDAKSVISKFLANFEKKYSGELQEAAEQTGYSLYELLTVASMVEREAKLDDERRVIASVIYNRLESPDFPYLQIDATVAYILGRAPTDDDLDIDDPYNTYVYEGLPPGPIANPGLESIEAAIKPADTKYYFYVARSDGSHIFSRTASEHAAAVKKVTED